MVLRRLGRGEQFTASCELGAAAAVSQETVVTDVHKARGPEVKKEATEELGPFERHGAVTMVAVVFPAEGDLMEVHLEETVVGDSHAVGVSGQVLEGLGGSPEGGFGVDHPFLLAKLVEELSEGGGGSEGSCAAVEGQVSLLACPLEPPAELGAEETAQHSHGKKETRAGKDPAGAIVGETAPGNETV